jgi:hypothetical protein
VVIALVLSGGLVKLGVWIASRRGDHINELTFSQIKLGMTEYEVETILGGPPRNCCAEDTDVIIMGWLPLFAPEFYSREGQRSPDGRVSRGWFSRCAWIMLDFDHDNKVCRKQMLEVYSKRETILDKVRQALDRNFT